MLAECRSPCCLCRSIVGGEVIGRISLQNLDREHAFGEGDVRLLTTLAGSLSVALENARLFEETRQRNAELALINDVQRGLAENLEMQSMYDLVGDRIQEIFDAQIVNIDDPRRRRRTHLLRLRDRTGGPLPHGPDRDPRLPEDRARDERAGHHQRRHRATVGGGRPSEGDLGRGSPVRGLRPTPRERPGDRVDLAAEHRSGARVQRRGRSTAHDDRREPERRARERAPVRGDASTERRARADQRRPARPGREPRDAGDVRPRRRSDPRHLRCAGRQHRCARRGRRASLASPTRSRRGERLPAEPRAPDGVPQTRPRNAGTTPVPRRITPELLAEFRQPEVLVGETAEVVGLGPAGRLGQRRPA